MSLAGVLVLFAAMVSQPTTPSRARVVFELRTPGAHVELVHGSAVRVVTMFPVAVSFDTAQRWTVHATKPGYCPLVRDVDYGKAVFTIELRPGC